MYDNIGDKIKAVAVIGCILEVIACVIAGISLISNSSRYNPTATAGWIILLAGSLVAWVSSFCLYGFGELIEKTCANNASLTKMEGELIDLKKQLSAETKKSAVAVSDSTRNTASQNTIEIEPVVVDNNTSLSDRRIIYNNNPLQTLIDSPLRIEEVSLLADPSDNRVRGNIKFFNQSKKNIIAIIVNLEAFNIAGEKVDLDTPRFVYQNMRLASGEMYGYQSSFALPSIVRSINVVLDKVVFEDNEVWKAYMASSCSVQKPIELNIPQTHHFQIMDKVSQLVVDTNYITYQYAEGTNYWQCTCGTINSRKNSKCSFCPNTKDQKTVLTQKAIDSMVQTIDAELAEQKRKAELARQEEERKRREEQIRREAEKIRAEQSNKEDSENTVAQKGFDYPYPLKHYNGICPNCGLKHYNNRSSCVKCGSTFASEDAVDSLFEVAVHCPKCGKKLAEGVKFCYSCGTKIE